MMLYTVNRSLERKAKLHSILHHPYFGFIVLGILLLFVQFLRITGVDIPITVLRGFGLTMIYIIIALGFSILLGYAGLASLGTAGFVGIGTYLIGYLTNAKGYSISMILVIGFLGAIAIGTIVGFISLRIEGLYLGIITLGLSEILNEVFKNATSITNGTNGLLMNRIVLFGQYYQFDSNTIFIAIVFILILVMVLTLNIMKSPTGRAMLAMRNSESAAQAMGVSVLKYRLLAFIIATVYAFLGGILYMTYIGFSIPTTWNLAFSLFVLAAVIVGGSQSIAGVVLGTFMIFGLDLAVFQQIPLFQENPAITFILNGVLIVVVVMFYPGGLIRLLTNLKYKVTGLYKKIMKKWKAYKYGDND